MLSGTEASVRANLYFVLPSECKDEDDIDDEIKMAFQVGVIILTLIHSIVFQFLYHNV